MPKQIVTIEVDVPEGYVAERTGGTAKRHGCTVRFAFVPAKPRYFVGPLSESIYRMTSTSQEIFRDTWHNLLSSTVNLARCISDKWTEITEAEAMARIQPKPKPEVVCGRCGWEGGRHDVKRAEYVADHLIPVVCPQCGSRNWDFHDTRDTK